MVPVLAECRLLRVPQIGPPPSLKQQVKPGGKTAV